MDKERDKSPKHHSRDLPSGESRQCVVDARASSTADPGPQPGGQPEAVDPELQTARNEVQATFAQYQRLAADFENYKRRTRQELADRTQYANEELLRKLLAILDNFKR